MPMSIRKIIMLICAALFSVSLTVQAADDKGEMKDQGSAPAAEATAAGDENKGEMKDEEMKKDDMKGEEMKKDDMKSEEKMK